MNAATYVCVGTRDNIWWVRTLWSVWVVLSILKVLKSEIFEAPPKLRCSRNVKSVGKEAMSCPNIHNVPIPMFCGICTFMLLSLEPQKHLNHSAWSRQGCARDNGTKRTLKRFDMGLQYHIVKCWGFLMTYGYILIWL